MRLPDLPAPVRTLVAAGRAALKSRPLRDVSSTPSAVDELTDYALRHGMLAWVANGVRQEALVAHMTRALEGVQQLLDVAARFEQNGLPFVALKGPAFAQWVYGDAGARRFSDLDVLVAAEERDRARRVLEEMGFARRIPSAAGDVVYASIGAWSMVHANRLPVDVHWTLAGRRFSRALSPADVLREAVPVQIAGRRVHVPRPEHAAVIALMHSAKHLWYALELPFSIATLASRQDVDWQVVRDLTARAGALRAAAAGLALAADLFGVEVPEPFRSDAALADVRDLRRCAFDVLALPPGTFADRKVERRIQRLSFDRLTDRVVYDIRRVIEPTRAEWEWLPLPPPLASLYWPARLVRVALVALHAGGGPRRTRA